MNVVTKEDANSNLNVANDYEYSREDGSSSLIVVDTDDDEIDNSKIQSNTVTMPTTTTVPKIGLKEEEIAPEIHAEIAPDKICIEIALNEEYISKSNLVWNTNNQNKENSISNKVEHADLYSDDLVMADTEVVVSNKNSSNLTAAAAATDDDDDNNNAKSLPKCENLIGYLDGIQDEYYHVRQKYGSIIDRSDDFNPPPLPPESSAYAVNIPCIHSNVPNDGEILSLPLFSSLYILSGII